MICGKPRVYNRGLVLARLQMQLQDVGPLKLPWSDCMLGPGQKVTASWLKCTLYTCQLMNLKKKHRSGLFLELVRYFYPFFFSGYLSTRIQWDQVPIDITQSEPGEWHGYIRIKGSWVTRIDRLQEFFVSFNVICISYCILLLINIYEHLSMFFF